MRLRQQAGQVEMIYYAYALDQMEHLFGVVSFRELLSAERSRRVREVMRTDYVFVVEDADQETVAQFLAKRRLLAVPVLDQEGHMLGIVTAQTLPDWFSRKPERTSSKLAVWRRWTAPTWKSLSGRWCANERDGSPFFLWARC